MTDNDWDAEVIHLGFETNGEPTIVRKNIGDADLLTLEQKFPVNEKPDPLNAIPALVAEVRRLHAQDVKARQLIASMLEQLNEWLTRAPRDGSKVRPPPVHVLDVVVAARVFLE